LSILPTTNHGLKFSVFDYDVIQNLKDQFVPNQTEDFNICFLFFVLQYVHNKKLEGSVFNLLDLLFITLNC